MESEVIDALVALRDAISGKVISAETNEAIRAVLIRLFQRFVVVPDEPRGLIVWPVYREEHARAMVRDGRVPSWRGSCK